MTTFIGFKIEDPGSQNFEAYWKENAEKTLNHHIAEPGVSSANMTKEGKERDIVSITKSNDHKDRETWIIDSGISHHYFGNCEDIQNSKIVHFWGPDRNFCWSNKVVPIISVKYIENMLRSIRKITQDPNVSVKFQGSNFTVAYGDQVRTTRVRVEKTLYRTTGTHKTSSILMIIDNLERAESDDSSPNDYGGFSNHNNDSKLRDWHHRLGHLSKIGLSHLARLHQIQINKSGLHRRLNCGDCQKGESPNDFESSSAFRLIFSSSLGNRHW